MVHFLHKEWAPSSAARQYNLTFSPRICTIDPPKLLPIVLDRIALSLHYGEYCLSGLGNQLPLCYNLSRFHLFPILIYILDHRQTATSHFIILITILVAKLSIAQGVYVNDDPT